MGRKSKLTDVTKRNILQVISVGGSKSLACAHAGITLPTLLNWLKRGEESNRGVYADFYNEYKQAEARPDIMAMGMVFKAVQEGDLKASMWWLEKKAGWGQQQESPVQINISPEQMSVKQLLRRAELLSDSIKTIAPPVIDLDED